MHAGIELLGLYIIDTVPWSVADFASWKPHIIQLCERLEVKADLNKLLQVDDSNTLGDLLLSCGFSALDVVTIRQVLAEHAAHRLAVEHYHQSKQPSNELEQQIEALTSRGQAAIRVRLYLTNLSKFTTQISALCRS